MRGVHWMGIALILIVGLAGCGGSGKDGTPGLSVPETVAPTQTSAPSPTVEVTVAEDRSADVAATELGVTRYGEGMVHSVQWSPEGDELGAAGVRGVYRFASNDLGGEPEILPFHALALAYSPDGRWLAGIAEDGSAQIWDRATGEVAFTLATVPYDAIRWPETSRSVIMGPPPAFSPDGSRLAFKRGESIQVWTLTDGAAEPEVIDIPEERLLGFGFRDDGTLLAAGSVNNLPDWTSATAIYAEDMPDDFVIRLYDADALTQLSTLQEPNGPANMALFYAGGAQVLVYTQGSFVFSDKPATVMAWDVETGDLLGMVEPPRGMRFDGVHGMSLAFDECCLMTYYSAPEDNTGNFDPNDPFVYTFMVSDLTGFAPQARLATTLPTPFLGWIALAPSGDKLAAQTTDATIAIWSLDDLPAADVDEGVLLPDPRYIIDRFTSQLGAVTLSDDETRIAAQTWNDSVYVWDRATGERVLHLSGDEYLAQAAQLGIQFELSMPNGLAAVLALSPDGELYAQNNGDALVVVRESATDDMVRTLMTSYQVRALAFSPDGTTLAVGTGDGRIALWDYMAREETLVWPAHGQQLTELAFTPEGQLFSLGYESDTTSTLAFWDTTTGTLVERMSFAADGPIQTMMLSSDRTRLALIVRGETTTIQVFDVESRAVVATLEDEEGVASLTFTPDDAQLLSSDYRGHVALWDLPAPAR